jgi:hypothetical protein
VSEMPPMTPNAIPPPPGPVLPWEEPNAGLGSIVPTVTGFVTRPIESFAKMSLTVDLVRPIAYFVILALIGACISQVWSYLLFDSIIGVVRNVFGAQFEKFAPLIHRPGAVQLVLTLVITPLVALIFLFIWTALVHLALALFGGANRGFATTLRVMCYSQTTELAVVIPFVGGLASFFWRLVLEIVGLSEAHQTEGWKAALGVLLPLALCCVCIIGGAVAFGTAVVQALQQAK